jgi:titin
MLEQLEDRTLLSSYAITDLGTLGGSASVAYSINNAGQVVGDADTSGNAAFHGFLYQNGSMTDLGTLGGTSSVAVGINSAGQVVGGAYRSGNAAFHGFLYQNGSMTDLGTLGGTSSVARGINNAGQVVGDADTSGNAADHAFLYQNGSMTDLGTLGGSVSVAQGINSAGQIVGDAYLSGNAADHAFLYQNGLMTDLGTLGGGNSAAYGINSAGQVVGLSVTSGNLAYHAFLYQNGGMTDLGTLGGTYSEAFSINSAGQIVGDAQTSGNLAYHAFLYQNGSMTDLNALTAGSGWNFQRAFAVNDSGQIVGSGSNPQGPGHAFLLTPKPTVTAPQSQNATEGASQAVSLGSFSDLSPVPWTVDVTWGDGTPNTIFSTTTPGALGTRNHSYAEEGTYTVTVKVTNSLNQSDSQTYQDAVADAPLSAIGRNLSATKNAPTGSVVLATFTDTGGAEALSNYSASLDWGDGSGTDTTGTITYNSSSGVFTVSGGHTYALAGSYVVTVTLNHETLTAPVQDPMTVYANPTVLNTNDSGPGSLRQAIFDADYLGSTYGGTNTIAFNIPGTGAHTIAPASALPALTVPVVMDGTTQPAFAGSPLIELNGNNPGAGPDGLVFSAGGSTVRGLMVDHFSVDGIALVGSGATGNVVQGNVLDYNGGAGLSIGPGASNNTVGGTSSAGRNVLSGNQYGVYISGPGTNGNIVVGNYIGIDAIGNALGNTKQGVVVTTGASNTLIASNVISANGSDGVQLAGNASGNQVQGNDIGTSAAGTAALPNLGSGISISSSANNLIGGTTSGNVISGNAWNGVTITDSGSTGNAVAGNYIGTNVTGTVALANRGSGVLITGGARNNRVGADGSSAATDAAERNIISGNAVMGVLLSGAGTNQNVVAGNFVGPNVTGNVSIGNGIQGIAIYNGAQLNRIGTSGHEADNAGERNVVSGAYYDDIDIGSSSYNVVAGNYVGVNAAGTRLLGRGVYGVFTYHHEIDLGTNATYNRVGTDGDGVGDAAERNVIAGADSAGVQFWTGAAYNRCSGNYVGTDATGAVALGNGINGIILMPGSHDNLIGTDGQSVDNAVEANVISGNTFAGVVLYGSNANVIAGNFIGTNAAGTASLPNTADGIDIASSAHNLIGGTAAGAGNVIAFNKGAGVALFGAFTGNAIRGNSIHDNTGLGIDLGGSGTPVLNDSLGHVGPNNYQNFPMLGLAAVSSVTTVTGTFSEAAEPNTTLMLDFYATSTADPSGYGQGERYLGSARVTTDAAGKVVSSPDGSAIVLSDGAGNHYFVVNLAATISVGKVISATATDANGNTSEFAQDIIARSATTTAVTPSAGPSVFGQVVTFTATVTANAAGAPTPTGTVQFVIDGQNYGTPVALFGGTASISDAALAVGSHTVAALYSGDAGSAPSDDTAAPLSQLVNKASTTTTVASSANQSDYGQAVTFTATVTVNSPGSALLANPTGSVTFYDNGTVLGSGTLSTTGGLTTATFTTTAFQLAVGSHTITAAYTSGDGNFNASLASAALAQTVLSAQQQAALLIGQVNVLVNAGILNSGDGNALTEKLNNATASLNAGSITAGVNQLHAFINQARAFQNAGKLTSDQADALINAADAAIFSAIGP